MKLNFTKRFFRKTLAKQLRRPGGRLAKKIGDKMNEINSSLYNFTINTLQLNDNDSILEIGFGNGKFFDELFSKANNLTISGLDFSSEMLKEASANNQSSINSGQLSLKMGSSDKIPFPDNSFDKVFCINVIYFWEQPSDHLREIYRVLNPGGKFYTSIRSKETILQMPFAKYGFTAYHVDEWKDLLESNQFHNVQTEKTQNEPDAEFEGELYKVESYCLVAEKQV